MIIETTRLNVLPNKRQELMQTLKALVSEIRKETGCQGCFFYQDTEDENRFILREEWANQAALDKHLQSHRHTVLVGAINLLSKTPEINSSTTEPPQRTKSGE
jgi:quinol monooxygenase YgiN